MNNTTVSQTILNMAAQRGPDKSVCPSEIARSLFPHEWRKHMQEVREAAIELQKAGKVSITQKGKPVDVDHIHGPVRIKIT